MKPDMRKERPRTVEPDSQAFQTEFERIVTRLQPHLLPIKTAEIRVESPTVQDPDSMDPVDTSAIQQQWENGRRLLLLFDPGRGLIEWVGKELVAHPERMALFVVRNRAALLEAMVAAHRNGWLDRSGLYWIDGEVLRSQIQEVFLKNSLFLFRPERIASHICVRTPPEVRQSLEEESAIFSRWFVAEREAHNRRFAALQTAQRAPLRVWGFALSGPGSYVHGPMLSALGRGFLEAGVEAEICSVDPKDPALSCRLLDQLTRFHPSVFLSLNMPIEEAYGFFLDSQAAQSLPQTRLIWLVDHPRFVSRRLFDKRDIVWASDNSYAAAARAMGARRVGVAPPATDLEREGVVREDLRCPIAFVGVFHDTTIFLDALAPWTRDVIESQVARMLAGEDVIAEHGFLAGAPREDLDRSRPILDEFCRRLSREFQDEETKLLFAAAVTAGSRRRAEVVRTLLPFGVCVYGNEGWKAVLGDAASDRFRGQAHRRDLPDIYASADLNLNCHSPQLPRGLNVRDFNVLRAGGCLLSDYLRDMERGVLQPSRDLAVYHDREDLEEMAERLLHSPEERRQLAQSGHREVLARHLYCHRVDWLRELF